MKRLKKKLDLHKNSRKLDSRDSISMQMLQWLKRKPGKNSRQVKRGKSEATKMTDSSTRAKVTRSWSKINEFELIMQKRLWSKS